MHWLQSPAISNATPAADFTIRLNIFIIQAALAPASSFINAKGSILTR
jgi:hypothetical protein